MAYCLNIKNVGDLKEAIKDLPDDMPVVVDGYEANYDDAYLKFLDLSLNAGAAHYQGPHIAKQDILREMDREDADPRLRVLNLRYKHCLVISKDDI